MLRDATGWSVGLPAIALGTMAFVTLGAHWGAEGALAGHMAGGIAFGLGAVVVVRSLIRRLERELGA